MEHEVFVPVPVRRLEETLADPARVARAVPGLQQDAGGEPVSGRLKLRVGSHSVTYRGAVRVTARQDGSYAVEGDATETRGSGSVKLALTLRVREADGGSTLAFEGTVSADGRVTELPAEAVGSAVARLLNRFAENLGALGELEGAAGAGAEGAEAPEPTVTREFEDKVTDDFETTPDAEDVPPPPSASLKPVAEGEDEDEVGAGGSEGFGEPAAEAAHARRTMIGRSAEEVDHAPPRGRYAPVPAPEGASQGSAALRWAAPAAAVVVASAIVVGRVLRRRR
jgi:carbon monoxide dehydrogenase subunit G